MLMAFRCHWQRAKIFACTFVCYRLHDCLAVVEFSTFYWIKWTYIRPFKQWFGRYVCIYQSHWFVPNLDGALKYIVWIGKIFIYKICVGLRPISYVMLTDNSTKDDYRLSLTMIQITLYPGVCISFLCRCFKVKRMCLWVQNTTTWKSLWHPCILIKSDIQSFVMIVNQVMSFKISSFKNICSGNFQMLTGNYDLSSQTASIFSVRIAQYKEWSECICPLEDYCYPLICPLMTSHLYRINLLRVFIMTTSNRVNA